VQWIEDDLTTVQRLSGAFDFLVDYGVYNDPSPAARRAYLRNVLPLTHDRSQLLI